MTAIRLRTKTLLERSLPLAFLLSLPGLAGGVAGCGAALAQSSECRESPSASLPEYPSGPHRDIVEIERSITRGATGTNSEAFLIEAARAYHDAGRTVAEIQALVRVVRDHPDSGQLDTVLFLLGTALLREGDEAAARTSLSRLIHDFPASRWVQGAHVALAELAWLEGDPQAARELLEEAARMGGSFSAYAHYRRAWVLAAMGDPAATSELDAAEALLLEGGMLETSTLRDAVATDRPTITQARCTPLVRAGR